MIRRLLAVPFLLAAGFGLLHSVQAQPAVTTGAQRLVNEGFAPLRALDPTPETPLRVGLITNPTAVVDTSDGGPRHLIDRMAHAEGVEVTALFGPEHGLRGEAEAGAQVKSGRDIATGAPVYSLYGRSRKPTPAHMQGLDVLAFDIQDIGARFYTYISTMGLAMQAAAEAGVPFVVLDRPNPIGGRVEGPLLRQAHASFVGMYPMPVTHGMTVGEVARMIAGEAWLPGLGDLDLHVIDLGDWTRDMPWEATGLPWVPPSPNIPDVETARVYSGAAFLEGSTASEGRGTRTPFLLVGAPWAGAEGLAHRLNAAGLRGVRFDPVHFRPRSIPGMAASPEHEGERIPGVRLVVTDPEAFRPVETGVHLMASLHAELPPAERADALNADWLAKLSGTRALYRVLRNGESVTDLVTLWHADAALFVNQREPYLLYP